MFETKIYINLILNLSNISSMREQIHFINIYQIIKMFLNLFLIGI